MPFMQEEGAAVTGHSEPHAAMRSVLSRPRSCTQWCIVKQGGQGSMLLTRDSPEVFDQPALKVRHAAPWLLSWYGFPCSCWPALLCQ